MGACNIEGTYVSTDWKTGIEEVGATPSFLQKYLYKVKKPSVLLKFSLNCFTVIAEGSVRDMKALACEELRKAKYVGSYYIVKKDKYWKCIGEQKNQKHNKK